MIKLNSTVVGKLSEFHNTLFVLLISTHAKVKSNEIIQVSSNGIEASTNVVSLAFCNVNLPAEDTRGKTRLEGIHTYAELKHDPLSSLPDSYTVCSTTMIPSCESFNNPVFFSILDENRGKLLDCKVNPVSIDAHLFVTLKRDPSICFR